MKKYITVSGDTWDLISFKHFGDHKHMGNLFEVNPDYISVLIFSGGHEINIPEVVQETSLSLPPWKRGV